MGSQKPTSPTRPYARPRRLRPRICLRKGCPRRFQPACWNQRYCQQPECLREVRRWQAARRQRNCRQQPQGRHKHAQAEQKRRAQRQARQAQASPDCCVTSAPGACAWSRSEPLRRGPLCDRPGCFDAPRHSPRSPARYCSESCRNDLRRVCDRERKYLMRQRLAIQAQRRLEYQATRIKRRLSSPAPQWRKPSAHDGATASAASARSAAIPLASASRYLAAPKEVDHDSQTSSRARADPPAAS